MAKAIRIHETGGPEVLRYEDVEVGEPKEGEARVRHTAIGVNYVDTYHRSGLYKLALPVGLGVEGVGVVEAVGKGVSEVRPGDRVAYAGSSPGSYSQVRLIPADRLLRLPAGIGDPQAAAMMLKGLTAWMLTHRVHAVRAGETVLFHAAAGGVGLIAIQWLKALGATVIGTVGSDEKAKVARAHGCDQVIVYTREDFMKRVRELTAGAGVRVVYDSVGKDTFQGSLDCLSPAGLMVSYGNASGAVPPFDIAQLAAKGSLFLTRPTIFSYTARREDLEAGARELFRVVESGKVKVEVGRTYPLAEAAQAHRDLQSRKTTGSLILLPG
jgi:NADPH2:quinone reductase